MTDVDRKHVRAVITRMLNRQPLTLAQLQDELEHMAPANVVRDQVKSLVLSDVVVACGGTAVNGHTAVFETWSNVVARLKDRPAPSPRRCHSVRNPRRVA